MPNILLEKDSCKGFSYLFFVVNWINWMRCLKLTHKKPKG